MANLLNSGARGLPSLSCPFVKREVSEGFSTLTQSIWKSDDGESQQLQHPSALSSSQ